MKGIVAHDLVLPVVGAGLTVEIHVLRITEVVTEQTGLGVTGRVACSIVH